MNVVCIYVKPAHNLPLENGKQYQVSRDSIWLDSDGDAYGKVYDMSGKFLGEMMLLHFKSI